jgi:hypothetical protein
MGRTMVAAVGAAWLLSFTTVAQSDSLTTAEIEAAIKWGESGNAAPYLLHHAAQPGTTSDVVVGAVYTPFVRVALVAKAAWDGGQHLTREDVPSPLAEPVVLIAFRWYCCDSDHGDQWNYHPLEPFDYKVGTPGQTWNWARAILARPLWVRRDLAMLNALGGIPYSDVVLLAAYPSSALSQPSDFVIYRDIPNTINPRGPATEAQVGRITTADVQRWR